MKCRNYEYCKSEEEINEYMRKRYLILLTNQIRFDPNNLGKEAIVKESVIEWFRLSVKTQQDFPKLLTLTNLEL